MSNSSSFTDAAQIANLIPVNTLPEVFKESLLPSYQRKTYKAGDYIIKQGQTDSDIFYLLTGSVMLDDGKSTSIIQHTSKKAKYPISPGLPRAYSVVAKSDCEILLIESRVLDTCLIWSQSSQRKSDHEWLASLSHNHLFSKIPAANIPEIMDRLQIIKVKKNDIIIKQGDEGDFYYIIQKGSCRVERSSRKNQAAVTVAKLEKNDCFGEEALLSACKRNASVIMLTDGVLARMTKADFIELIKQPVIKTIHQNEINNLPRDKYVLLDVRSTDEYKINPIKNSTSIPLDQLRKSFTTLDHSKHYVVFCDSGKRSTVAAFLLTQQNFKASQLLHKPATKSSGSLANVNNNDATLLSIELARVRQDVVRAVHQKATADVSLTATESQENTLTKQAVASGFPDDLKKQLEKQKKHYLKEVKQAELALRKAKTTRLKLGSIINEYEELTEQDINSAKANIRELARDSKQALTNGEKRLKQEYKEINSELDALQKLRNKKESTFTQNQQRLNNQHQLQSQQLEKLSAQIKQIKSSMAQINNLLRTNDQQHRQECAQMDDQRHSLQADAELRLRMQRVQLETDFIESMQLIEAEQKKKQDAEKVIQTFKKADLIIKQQLEQEISSLKEQSENKFSSKEKSLLAQAQKLQVLNKQSHDKTIDSQLASNELNQKVIKTVRSRLEATESSLGKKVSKEINQWLKEDEQKQIVKTKALRGIKTHIENVSRRIASEKAMESQETDNMFDEIRKQLNGDD